MAAAGGQLLANATIKLWYLSNFDKPKMAMLDEWSGYFNRRVHFLPLILLKKQLTTRTTKTAPRKSQSKAKVNRASKAPTAYFSGLSMTNVIMILCFIGGVHHYLSYQSGQREFESKYDQIVNYKDSI
jgi:hypothetical protein